MQRPPKGDFDAIVIGSGIGGLVAASLLAREGGQRVLVLERHYRIGGYTHVFTRPGYEWDVGVHYVGRVSKGELLRSLFDRVSDGKLEWVSLPDVYDAIEIRERRFEFHSGRAAFIEGLAPHFEGKRDALERYARLITATARKVQLELINRVARPNTARISAHRLAPSIPEWAQKTTRQTLTELGFDQLQLAALSGQYGDYGPAPARSSFALHAAVADHYLDGAYYPLGGSSRFAQTIVPAIEAAGGHLATMAEVKRIVLDGEKATGVELTNGRVFNAKTIISDVGGRKTYAEMLPEAQRPRELLEALERAKPSSAYLCLYLGMNATDAELGLTGTNLWLHPHEDFDANIERFENDVNAPFPVLYLSFPSAKDPDFQR
ncbi:MAG: NAD(P)/FAD-dependent oxidoreductase, partial [Archangium sp.]|nr:NAD(P)/FAD-dependent oxidoreductase [Archangium sp.]